MIRCLVVDDSRSFRAILRAILSEAPGVEVVGEAADGDEAIAKVLELRPDVVTMDVRMPGKDGLETIEEVMARAPTPIIVVSAEAGPEKQELAFRALQLGAIEVLGKPRSDGNGRFQREAEAIRMAVRAVAGLKLVTRHPRHARRAAAVALTPATRSGTAPPAPARREPPKSVRPEPAEGRSPRATAPVAPSPVRPEPAERRAPVANVPPPPWASVRPTGDASERVVGIAASTGGPAALARILAALPGDYPLPIVVVQHIAHGFEGGLVHWLSGETRLSVKLAEDGEALVPGRVYIAPDGRHTGVAAGAIRLWDGPPVRGFKPSGTVLFESLASACGSSAAGLVLSGMGDDGAAGLAALRAAGGWTAAQGPATSVIYGMPRAAIERGAASETLEVDDVAPALLRFARRDPPLR